MTRSPFVRHGHGQPARVPPEDDQGKRYAFAEGARCPGCQSTDYGIYGWTRAARESRDPKQGRYAKCNQCGQQFVVVTE